MKKTISAVIILLLSGPIESISRNNFEKIEYKSFVVIEAEDAIATNFANRPTSFFFASNKHTLQLSKESSGDDANFFAKYVFFNTIDREYDIWLGATPPGSGSNPYISPISVRFDDGNEFEVTSKNVKYSDRYAQGGFYYYKILSGRIPYGERRLEIIVKKPRDYDGKFVFYLDNIIIVPKYNKNFLRSQRLPRHFPKNLKPAKRFQFRDIKKIPPYKRIRSSEILKNYAISLGWAGQFDNSRKIYEHLIKRNARDVEAQIGFILTEIWRGNNSTAYKHLDGLLSSPSVKKEIKISLMKFRAQMASWNGDYESSKKIYKNILNRKSGDAEAIIGLGNTYTWSGEIDKAISLYEDAIKRFGGNIDIMFAVAENYEKNKLYKRAIIVYKKIIEKLPDDFLAYRKLASLYTRIGEDQKSEEILMLGRKRKAVEKVEKGKLSGKMVHSKDKIIKEYETASENDFFNIQKHKNLLSTYEWYKVEDKALKEYKIILALRLYNSLTETEKRYPKLFLNISKISYLHKNSSCIDESAEKELNKIKSEIKGIKSNFNEFIRRKKDINWNIEIYNIKDRLRALGVNHYLYRRIDSSLKYLSGNISDSNQSIMKNILKGKKAKEEYIAPFILLESGNIITLNESLKRMIFHKEYRDVIDNLKRFSSVFVCKEKAKGLSSGEKSRIKLLHNELEEIRRLIFEEVIFTYYLQCLDFLKKLGEYCIYLKNPNEAQSVFLEILKMQPDNPESNLRLGDLYRWGRRYYSSVVHYENVLNLDFKNKRATKGRDEVLSYISPRIYLDTIYHNEPIVSRLKTRLIGEYALNDYFKLKGFYGFSSVSDKLGFQVSDIYSNAQSELKYHEAGAEIFFNLYSFYSLFSLGYFARSYKGDMDFEYLDEYSAGFDRNITHNYYATFRWMPINFPFSLNVLYEYADFVELTQTVKLGLYYNRLEVIPNLAFDFFPFFPFDRLSYYGNHDYRIISDDNRLFKNYNKLILNILHFPFIGIKFDITGIYIYEDSEFNAYDEDNSIYKKQVNVPYYAPVDLYTYGGSGEWSHDITGLIKFYSVYIFGMNYLITSDDATIYNPYMTIKGEYRRFIWEFGASYLYSKSYDKYETGEAFKSYDLSLKFSRKFYSDYTPEVNFSKSAAKIAPEKKSYSLSSDKSVTFLLGAYDTAGISSYKIIIRDKDGNSVKVVIGNGAPPGRFNWNMLYGKKKKIRPGDYRTRLSIINKKGEEIYSDDVLFKIE